MIGAPAEHTRLTRTQDDKGQTDCQLMSRKPRGLSRIKGDQMAVEVQGRSSSLRCHVLRLVPGQELKTALQEYVKQNDIKAAFIMTCCGSVTQATLRFASDANSAHKVQTVKQQYEIVSMVGTISQYGHHLHVSLGDDKGDVIGGHVMGDMIIYTTAEIVLGECMDLKFTRPPDERTQYDELFISPNEPSEHILGK